jgi:glutaredoxin
MSLSLPAPLVETNFTVYTKSKCPYCDKIKALLVKERDVVLVNCDPFLPEKRDALLANMKSWAHGTEIRTFPIVFRYGQYIGGFTQTQSLLEKESAFSF